MVRLDILLLLTFHDGVDEYWAAADIGLVEWDRVELEETILLNTPQQKLTGIDDLELFYVWRGYFLRKIVRIINLFLCGLFEIELHFKVEFLAEKSAARLIGSRWESRLELASEVNDLAELDALIWTSDVEYPRAVGAFFC